MGLNNYQNIISICSSTTIPWIYDFFCTFLSRGRSLIFSNRCTTMLIIVLYVLSRSGFNVCLQRDVLSSYDVHSEADETVISAE